MRIERRLLLAAGLLSASIAGCPLVLSDDFRVVQEAGIGGPGGDERDEVGSSDAVETTTDATEVATEDADAGAADADASSRGEGGDSASKADATACCGSSLNDPIDQATFDHWIPLGVARGLPGFTELTPDLPNQAGGIVWPRKEALSDFELEFDFSITQSPEAGGVTADGLAFVAVNNAGGVCEAGSNLCVLGTTSGFGVLVRTYATAKEPPAPYVALIDTSRSLYDDAGPPILGGAIAHPDGGLVALLAPADAAPPAGSWRTVCIKVVAGKASVKLGGQTLFSGVALSGPQLSSWGFVGATGAYAERNAVRRVRLNLTSGCGDAAVCADAGLCGL